MYKISFNPSQIELGKLTFGVLDSPGISFVERTMVNLTEITNPPIKDNPTRSRGKDYSHVHLITQSFENGIDYTKMPPTLLRLSTPMMGNDGNILKYQILTGSHRLEAFRGLGFESWVFDVYDISRNSKFSYREIKETFQLRENNHSPALPASEEDVTKTVLSLIAKGSKLVLPEEASIRAYIYENCSNMHRNTQNKCVKQILRSLQKNGTVVCDFYSYTAEDVKDFISQKTDLKQSGSYDPKRDEYGWTLLQGYEQEYIMNAARKFAETGKKSYFTLHTKTPTEDSSLEDRRQRMTENLNDFGMVIVKCADYYRKHGTLPWYIMGFLPQDLAAGEEDYIPFK